MKKESKIKFYWPKWVKGKGFNTNRVKSSTILINGITFTCILLSISSGIVDIVCYSGLSVSKFHLGIIPFAASLLYTIISIGLTSGKFWAQMKIGMLKELKNRLRVAGKKWYKNIDKALLPWEAMHKALIGISLLTALSMSVNSIGAGIRTMQQNINNMTVDANTLIELNKSVSTGVKDKRDATKENIYSSKTAKDDAKKEVERYYDRLAKYQEEYFNLSDEDKTGKKGQDIINKIVKEIPGTTSANALYFTKANLQKYIQSTATKNEVIDTSNVYEEGIAYDKTQIEETIKALADKEYKKPNGELIKFINEDGSVINVQLAISRLQSAISDWQSSTGDVGESSKVFTLLATYMHADTKAGGMGAAEWMLLSFIFISGIIQEILISLCTPKSIIDGKVLSQVSSYLEWESIEEKEKFLINVYIDYNSDKILSQEECDALCLDCVKASKINADMYFKKYEELDKPTKVITKVIEKPVIKEVVKEIPIKEYVEKIIEKKEEPKTVKVEIPLGDKTLTVNNVPAEEAPNNQMVVKSAERELMEMINEKH